MFTSDSLASGRLQEGGVAEGVVLLRTTQVGCHRDQLFTPPASSRPRFSHGQRSCQPMVLRESPSPSWLHLLESGCQAPGNHMLALSGCPEQPPQAFSLFTFSVAAPRLWLQRRGNDDI